MNVTPAKGTAGTDPRSQSLIYVILIVIIGLLSTCTYRHMVQMDIINHIRDERLCT